MKFNKIVKEWNDELDDAVERIEPSLPIKRDLEAEKNKNEDKVLSTLKAALTEIVNSQAVRCRIAKRIAANALSIANRYQEL